MSWAITGAFAVILTVLFLIRDLLKRIADELAEINVHLRSIQADTSNLDSIETEISTASRRARERASHINMP